MDKKLAQHLNMKKDYMFMRLMDDAYKKAAHKVYSCEKSYGFGFDDEYDDEAYNEFTETNALFKELWEKQCKALDDWREALNRFCESMVRFTDGQIDHKTAKKMATNPHYAEQLEAVMFGKE